MYHQLILVHSTYTVKLPVERITLFQTDISNMQQLTTAMFCQKDKKK